MKFLFLHKEEEQKWGFFLNICKQGGAGISNLQKKKKNLDKERGARTPAGSHGVTQAALGGGKGLLKKPPLHSAHTSLAVTPQASPSPLWGRRWEGPPGPQLPGQPTPAFLEQGVCRSADRHSPGVGRQSTGAPQQADLHAPDGTCVTQ